MCESWLADVTCLAMLCVKVSCVSVCFNTVSVGYGDEVGLNSGIQELWDPLQGKSFFIDHIHLATFWEDPRPPPPVKPDVTCTVRWSLLLLPSHGVQWTCWLLCYVPSNSHHIREHL